MDGFDTSTMTYMASAMHMPPVTDQDGFSKPGLAPMEMHDMYSNFDMSTFAGSEDFTFHPHGMHPSVSPGLRRMQSTFEDQFSDVISAVETQTNHEAQDPEATIDRDNKLLSFSTPSFDHVLLDYAFRSTTISLGAQLHGMFFLAESPWGTTADAVPPPSELTCYRRNLFQITGSITLPRGLRYILTPSGEQLPIIGQELTVSATESTEGNPVKIISVPWKTPINPTQAPADDKTEREPPTIPIDLNNAQDMDSEFAQYPFQWKRLQFRIATANNGRRKELQQHFVVRLKVLATLSNGSKMPICEVRSSPVIVRGRSPRNFQSRKDTPLNGTASHARKAGTSNPQPQNNRTTSGDAVTKAAQANGNTALKVEAVQPAQSVISCYEPDFQNGQDFYDGIRTNTMQQGTMIAVPQEPFALDRHLGYAASSPDISRQMRPLPHTSQPINLSLVEDDPPKMVVPKDLAPPSKRPSIPPPRPPSFSINSVSTPDESADLLYEYFPLGLDDWMPAVHGVFRPHAIHHIKVAVDPRDPSAVPARGRSKRYFSEAGM
ncbi:hypothetical protein BDZ85DRAFT_211319 [Elsinoe ampelina]|uniref:NDT80 domain-containing protein n=1 Tax=Elsinoe ampelina TaxID=302913 RepID=A0A6A6GLA9_9PEZI|nr:hypothetical protein BDZ85DRAFT_211319 [Elsinoe ampelina]